MQKELNTVIETLTANGCTVTASDDTNVYLSLIHI